MSGARNIVIAGDYYPFKVCKSGVSVYIMAGVFTNHIHIDSTTVESYKLIDSQNVDASLASMASRAAIGGAVAGDFGALAGIASAPDRNIYVVLINFKDGKQSLMEVDGEIYSAIKKNCVYKSDPNATFNNNAVKSLDNVKNVEAESGNEKLSKKKKHMGCLTALVILILVILLRNVPIGQSTLGEIFPYFVVIAVCLGIVAFVIIMIVNLIKRAVKK